MSLAHQESVHGLLLSVLEHSSQILLPVNETNRLSSPQRLAAEVADLAGGPTLDELVDGTDNSLALSL